MERNHLTTAYGTFKSNNLKRLRRFVDVASDTTTTTKQYMKARSNVIGTARDEALECDYERFKLVYAQYVIAEERLPADPSKEDEIAVANQLIGALSPTTNAPSQAYWQEFYGQYLYTHTDPEAPELNSKQEVVNALRKYKGDRKDIWGFAQIKDLFGGSLTTVQDN